MEIRGMESRIADITETAVPRIYFTLLRKFLVGPLADPIGLIERDDLALVADAGMVGALQLYYPRYS